VNQAAVLRRKKTWIDKLLHLIREADKIDRHVRTTRILRDTKGNPDLALTLRVETCRSQSASCGREKLSSCDHRISRFFSLLLAQIARVFLHPVKELAVAA
jgi:hypothetical protein